MDRQPRILGTANLVYAMDRHLPPAIEIDSGDVLAVQTLDARSGTVLSEDNLLDTPHPRGHNPATGPIFVRRSQAVDSLVVEILSIELADRAFVAIKKDVGLVRHHAGEYITRILPVQDGLVEFNDRIRFPARPMVGVIGTAPAGNGVATTFPGPHGGNMDNRFIRAGSRVHLPVFVPGALLALGDVHACMGDSEITMVGLEAAATVTVRVELDRGVHLSRPWIETENEWVTTGDGEDPVQALQEAADEMIHLLASRLYIRPEEAYMLVSARGDVQICQACDPGSFPVTARCVVPRLDRTTHAPTGAIEQAP